MSRTVLTLLTIATVLAFAATTRAYSSTATTRISNIVSYVDYGGGDVTFGVANPVSSCVGFWFKKGDPGFQSTLNTILSAYHARSTVVVNFEPSQLWTGSAFNYCRLHSIELR
jgi:hypothetical protein